MRFSSVQLLSHGLCDSMDCSTPGFPVRHQLPELALIHVHRVNDAIQPSHPLSSPSVFPTISVLCNESVLRIRWPKYWRFRFSISPSNKYSRLVPSRMDWLDLFDSQDSSPTPQFKSINYSADTKVSEEKESCFV